MPVACWRTEAVGGGLAFDSIRRHLETSGMMAHGVCVTLHVHMKVYGLFSCSPVTCSIFCQELFLQQSCLFFRDVFEGHR